MTTLLVNLPDELAAKLRARAVESGSVSVDAYIGELLRVQMELMDRGCPPGVLGEDDPELEAELLKRMNDARPGVEATPEFWNDLKRRVREGHGDARQLP